MAGWRVEVYNGAGWVEDSLIEAGVGKAIIGGFVGVTVFG